MDKTATWLGWRTPGIEAVVIARAVGLAIYSGDPETADRYLDKVAYIIDLLERTPMLGTQCPKLPASRFVQIGHPAPGKPDTLVYSYSFDAETLVGEGTFPFLPPKYR